MTTAVPLPAQRPLVLADVLGRSRTRDLALVVTAALFTAALAQIAIPVPGSPVPITGQTLAVVLTAAALGPHRGLAGQALYLVLGAIGLPFYSEASGGFEVISGATGGYIVGFLPAAYLIGLAAKHQLDRALWKALPLFVAGQAIIFAVGVPWLAVTAHLSAGEAIAAGFTPFIVGGLIKAAVAGAALPGLWKLTKRG
ncbi:biotin transporter BioY [Kribbella italica]|uniref:Biotin transporter n=1 Tax=Kribbella italica TaxID=1540520 RepID=A0A7W9JD05_9ACTN|nr:biotin transport system substrate-specific component [Kribbella italica]